MDLTTVKTIDNTEESQFELDIDGFIALISYKLSKSRAELYLVHTEVPDELEGKGIGHKIVRESLEIIEKRGDKIIPICPFIKSFIQDNLDAYKHLLSKKAKLELWQRK